MKKPVSFYSEGCRLVGDVYYPDGPAGMRPRAGIVLGHGYTGRHRESHGCIIWSRATIRKFEAELAYLGIMTPGEITLNVVRNDPADNRYLECALEGAAGVRRAAVRRRQPVSRRIPARSRARACRRRRRRDRASTPGGAGPRSR